MERAASRLRLIESHMTAQSPSKHVPKHSWFKPQGWGYSDTAFRINEEGDVELTGSRYLFSGQVLPAFVKWAELVVGLDLADFSPAQLSIPVQPPKRHPEFSERVQAFCLHSTEDDQERLFHSHGHTLQEIFHLRYGQLPRVADLVVYPGSHEHVEGLVQLAHELNVVLVPYGGGTNVTHALQCDDTDRTIVSVDMSKMNHVRQVNHIDMTAVVECGITGQALERELGRYGVCSGHEPDSSEFSTLGGWISTRASGMKKNAYGNIEDIVITFKLVTPTGTYERECKGPRISIGPDLNEFVLGHEGLLGILTEATIKVKPLPQVRAFGSYVFPDFEHGTAFMYECAKAGLRPASLRLVDNLQFQFAVALKPAVHSRWHQLIDRVKKYYVTQIKGFDPQTLCACTMVFEGRKDLTNFQQQQIKVIAAKHKGLSGGAENGVRGYFLTYMIAYLRDFAMDYYLVAESFETSVPWHLVSTLITNVTQRIQESCTAYGIVRKPFISSRITQVYDSVRAS